MRASRIKRRNRAKNTRAEIALRKELWALGARYRLHVKDLPGKPDLVFLRAKIAVFCDGDFWHGRDWPARRRRLQAGSNSRDWVEKIQANIDRDRRQEKELRADGWLVLRFWETDILEDPQRVALEVLDHVRCVHG